MSLRKSHIIISFLVILSLLSSHTIVLSASVGIQLGYFKPISSNDTIRLGYNVGGSLYLPLTDYLSFRATYELIRGNNQGEGHYSLLPLTFGGVVSLPTKKSVQPYFSLSLGYVRCANFPDTGGVVNSILYVPGGGVLFFQHSSYPLFIDVNLTYIRFGVNTGEDEKEIYSGIKFAVGFGYNM